MTLDVNITGFPLLSLITFLPTIGALFIILFINKEWENGVKWSALTVAVATFLLSLILPLTFDTKSAALQ